MLDKYIDIIVNAYTGFYNYLISEITLSYDYKPLGQNYFYLLIVVSLIFFLLEIAIPWRKKQAIMRKDFVLDVFYMFFNFFLFSLIIFNAASDVAVNLFNDGLAVVGINNIVLVEVQKMPIWVHLLLGFFVRDFVQWWIHRLLHRIPALWEFHKVHHSVEQMGFAAHLRYHWMENVVYRSLEYIPLAFIGIGLNDFFVIHLFTLIVGHYNHANINVPTWAKGMGFGAFIGLFVAFVALETSVGAATVVIAIATGLGLLMSPVIKYIFNSPEMHIWHHAYHLPEERQYGVNFALTLSCWDYLFGTNYIPRSGRDIPLGFPTVEEFPDSFIQQNTHGFMK